MNGQIFQICRIVVAAKQALRTNSAISYAPIAYENKIEFNFLPNVTLYSNQSYMARNGNVEEWFEYCLKLGMQDIKVTVPTVVKDRYILGYSNTSQSAMICYFKKNQTYFNAQWEFDSVQKVWNIVYTEHKLIDFPDKKRYFDNNSEALKDILIKIKELAVQIDCVHFANVFQHAIDILEDTDDHNNTSELPLPAISGDYLRLFNAAGIADVFGAMGSWNDSPPYMAHEKGLNELYESLSNELLKQLRYAILYAINES